MMNRRRIIVLRDIQNISLMKDRLTDIAVVFVFEVVVIKKQLFIQYEQHLFNMSNSTCRPRTERESLPRKDPSDIILTLSCLPRE